MYNKHVTHKNFTNVTDRSFKWNIEVIVLILLLNDIYHSHILNGLIKKNEHYCERKAKKKKLLYESYLYSFLKNLEMTGR